MSHATVTRWKPQGSPSPAAALLLRSSRRCRFIPGTRRRIGGLSPDPGHCLSEQVQDPPPPGATSLLLSHVDMFGNGHQGAIGLGRLEVIADPSKVRVLLEDWLEWCEQFHVAVEAPRGEDDGELWKLVFENADCLGAIHASRLQDAEPALVLVLQESGRLRVFADPAEARGNLLWFVRGVETRVAWPGGAVDDELLSSSRAPWVFLGGATAE